MSELLPVLAAEGAVLEALWTEALEELSDPGLVMGGVRAELVVTTGTGGTADTTGATADTTGVTADTTGATADTTGVTSETTGATADTTGVTSETTGATADTTGVTAETTGATADTTGATADTTAETTGATAGIAGVSALLPAVGCVVDAGVVLEDGADAVAAVAWAVFAVVLVNKAGAVPARPEGEAEPTRPVREGGAMVVAEATPCNSRVRRKPT